MSFQYITDKENAAKIKGWFDQRGGIIIWTTLALDIAGRQWATPCIDAEGKPFGPPHWSCPKELGSGTDNPLLITDPAQVGVHVRTELKRYKFECPKVNLERAWKKYDRENPGQGVGYWLDTDKFEWVMDKNNATLPLIEFLEQANG